MQTVFVVIAVLSWAISLVSMILAMARCRNVLGFFFPGFFFMKREDFDEIGLMWVAICKISIIVFAISCVIIGILEEILIRI